MVIKYFFHIERATLAIFNKLPIAHVLMLYQSKEWDVTIPQNLKLIMLYGNVNSFSQLSMLFLLFIDLFSIFDENIDYNRLILHYQ